MPALYLQYEQKAQRKRIQKMMENKSKRSSCLSRFFPFVVYAECRLIVIFGWTFNKTTKKKSQQQNNYWKQYGQVVARAFVSAYLALDKIPIVAQHEA